MSKPQRSRDNERRLNLLRRTANETRRYRTTMKILVTALLLLVVPISLLYVSASLYQKDGSFTISLNKFEMTKYGLSLSESRDLTHQTSHLNARIAEDITNMASEELPDNLDTERDGSHNGKDYIAYTFYLQNTGEVAVSYEWAVHMSGISNGVDEAVRLRIYVDGTPTTYAKERSDGSHEPEAGCEPFYSATEMARGRIDDFSPEDVTKFTVVIWIEGSDPDCVDWLIGGQMKIDMTMSVVH